MAIQWRKEGRSYREISDGLGVSKGTCSLWLKDMPMHKKAKDRIEKLIVDGRALGQQGIRAKWQKRDDEIRAKVLVGMGQINITQEVGKLLCAMLYWGEGSKDRWSVRFMSSDPSMIATYLWLLRSFYDVRPEKFRAELHLYSYHNTEKQKKFWTGITSIPENMIHIYKKENSGKNIKAGYPGCISIRYYDVRLATEIQFYYNALIDKIGV